MARPSIAIVITFFGRAPLWLPAFLVSCAANQDVQWLIYTDFDPPAAVPPNITLKHIEIQQLNQLASDVLATHMDLQRFPRKLCDLKPAYGVVFADDLRDFDFWAHSDLDVIWGDIRHFMTNTILDNHDIVSSRAGRLSGHFTLFRNTPSTNRTFELIPDYRSAMSTTRYEHLDERELTRHLRDRLRTRPQDGAPRVYWDEELTTNADYQRALGNRDTDNLWWRKGKTFDADGHELMYLHFHKLKQDMRTTDVRFEDAPASFRINRIGLSI